MYYYKNRTYHAELGVFMQADPIGHSGGVNLYAYVGGDPVNFTDPWGLSKKPPSKKPPAECYIDPQWGCQFDTIIVGPGVSWSGPRGVRLAGGGGYKNPVRNKPDVRGGCGGTARSGTRAFEGGDVVGTMGGGVEEWAQTMANSGLADAISDLSQYQDLEIGWSFYAYFPQGAETDAGWPDDTPVMIGRGVYGGHRSVNPLQPIPRGAIRVGLGHSHGAQGYGPRGASEGDERYGFPHVLIDDDFSVWTSRSGRVFRDSGLTAGTELCENAYI